MVIARRNTILTTSLYAHTMDYLLKLLRWTPLPRLPLLTNSQRSMASRARLSSHMSIPLFFPHSFPYDFMHLIWENTIKNMILHWTGEFKGLDQGNGTYELSKAIWEGIGTLTASSGSTIPSAYGSRVPNIKKDHHICTADMWSFWTLYISPILLWRRFDNVKYYKHFILLVKLLTACLKFEITHEEIDFIRNGFVDWVEKYERYAS
jgi:hypothetical protein